VEMQPHANGGSADWMSAVDFLFSRVPVNRSRAAALAPLPAIASPRLAAVERLAVRLPAQEAFTGSASALGTEDAPDDLEWLFADEPAAG